jgi:hypothetical protein
MGIERLSACGPQLPSTGRESPLALRAGLLHVSLASAFARRIPTPKKPKEDESEMRRSATPDLQERLRESTEAKKALLDKFRAAPGPDDPAVAARRAEREAIVAARAARMAEREAARRAREEALAEEARIAAELQAQAEREAAEAAARAAAEEAERAAAEAAAQKAARDARYAARKAAKKARRKGLLRE